MLTTGEQQELHQIEEDLRDTDRGFAWRLTLLEGILGWAGPGRQAYLLVLAVLAFALLWLVAAARAAADGLCRGRAEDGVGDRHGSRRRGLARLAVRQEPGHSGSPVRDRPQSDGTDLP